MMTYLEWRRTKRRKKPKEKGNEQLLTTRDREIGHLDHEGQADRSDSQIQPSNVYVFREPG